MPMLWGVKKRRLLSECGRAGGNRTFAAGAPVEREDIQLTDVQSIVGPRTGRSGSRDFLCVDAYVSFCILSNGNQTNLG